MKKKNLELDNEGWQNLGQESPVFYVSCCMYHTGRKIYFILLCLNQ